MLGEKTHQVLRELLRASTGGSVRDGNVMARSLDMIGHNSEHVAR